MKSPVGPLRIGYRYDIAMQQSPTKKEEGTSRESKTAKELWVKPKEKFMMLLETVGAKGSRFTAQEVMSLLIKYISSRHLFDPNDPKKVYCNRDPLGEVFGVSMFTIQDAKRLLFENLTVLQVPGQMSGSSPLNKSCYFTFSHQSIQNPKLLDKKSLQVDHMDSGRLSSMGGASRERVSSSSTPSSVQTKKTKKHRRRKRSKPKKSKTEGSSNPQGTNPENQPHGSSEKKESARPWYCIVYKSGEDLQSKSSEVLSVQDNETLEAEDSSDDLWFLEDEFAVEFEMQSESSGTYSQDQSSDNQSQGSEIIFDVKIESGESRQGDYSSEVETDEEIPEADKWQCAECETRNSPLCRYCVKCMAVRSGWLPDEQRMTPWERLHHQGCPLKRTMSAPASNTKQLQQLSPDRKTDGRLVAVQDVSDGKTDRPPLKPPPSDHTGTSEQSGADEAGNSSHHGSGSHTTASPPPEASHRLIKRPWGFFKPPEDSGFGQSQSSQEKLCQASSIQASGSQETSASCSQEPQRKRMRFETVQGESLGQGSNKQYSQGTSRHHSSGALGGSSQGGKSHGQTSSGSKPHGVDLCNFCCSRPKTGSIVHGSTGHQVCCYHCAKKLKKRGKPCPACRKPIELIIRNYVL